MRKLWRLALIVFMVTPLAFVPVHFSPAGADVDEAVDISACSAQALKDGTCCYEHSSWCNIGGDDHENYYAKLEGGSCN